MHYLFAVVLVGLAAALRVWPLQSLGTDLAWLTFYPAVLVVALYAGFFAGLLATLLSCLAVTLLGPLLVGQPFIESPADFLGVAVFAFGGLLVCAMVESLYRAKARADQALKQAQSAALSSARNEQFIRSIANAAPNMIGYWDRDLRCRFANQAYLAWFGKHPGELIGTHMRDLVGEQLYALNEPHIRGVLAGETQRFQRTLAKAGGGVGYILGNYIPDIDAHGVVNGFVTLAGEVTELKEAQAQLELAASVYANTVEGITVTDADGVILAVNPAFVEITGYSAAEAVGQTPRLLRSNRHDRAFYVAMWDSIKTNGRWKGDIWNRRKSGDIFLERITISMILSADGGPLRYVAVFSDITDLWRKDEYLRHLAFHDALTELPNRFLLLERLGQQIAIAQRERFSLAVLFLDLDGFKVVNDQFGHEVGDELLRVVAQRLQALVRQSDTVARLGGDEFVIALNNPANQDEVASIALHVVESLAGPMQLQGNGIQIGCSIGIALFPADALTPADLIKQADAAMYSAKAAGKNTWRFFDATMATPSDVQPR
ncbi:MAG: diguanylate cyclase [Gammaproteobacteria bacterium]|nr:diguanylate cyclase [Rhodoferax sp.]MBU3900252.1 diguanylate cyclase [Gammaproteobacteria bacterium]MBA3057915.1 diguanylate cyclase [Rhodoferax sp.]MBU3997962.1 diguanylate cyclase [Gammaproteobacteria bacterium]MBU4079410.1 diguanylate cyclase [Gammaproteobacteria bacterium]MBU4115023.1 diguanylate cyclase [Gammaproteobacteria bacterium]